MPGVQYAAEMVMATLCGPQGLFGFEHVILRLRKMNPRRNEQRKRILHLSSQPSVRAEYVAENCSPSTVEPSARLAWTEQQYIWLPSILIT
jgi:hypothetical protein